MYSSTLPSTSALDGVEEGSTPRSGRFHHGEAEVPIVYEAGWAPGPVWTGAEKISTPPGFDPRTVHPVASRYTDCANPDPVLIPKHKTTLPTNQYLSK